VHAAHLPPDARVLKIGAGIRITTAWLVAGLGARTDVDILSVEADETLTAAGRGYPWPSYVRIGTADIATVLADHPDTIHLIVADASGVTGDHLDTVVGASRSGGMLIVAHHKAVDAVASALRQTVLDHDALIAVDIDSPGGLLIAAKRQQFSSVRE